MGEEQGEGRDERGKGEGSDRLKRGSTIDRHNTISERKEEAERFGEKGWKRRGKTNGRGQRKTRKNKVGE